MGAISPTLLALLFARTIERSVDLGTCLACGTEIRHDSQGRPFHVGWRYFGEERGCALMEASRALLASEAMPGKSHTGMGLFDVLVGLSKEQGACLVCGAEFVQHYNDVLRQPVSQHPRPHPRCPLMEFYDDFNCWGFRI